MDQYVLTLENRVEYISHCVKITNKYLDISDRRASADILIAFLRTYMYNFLSRNNKPTTEFKNIFSLLPQLYEDPIVFVNTISLQCVVLISTLMDPTKYSVFNPVIWSNFNLFTNAINSIPSNKTKTNWLCSVCSNENNSGTENCEICNIPKPIEDIDILNTILRMYKNIIDASINSTIIVINNS